MRYRIALAACVVALALPAHAQDATDAQLAELNYQIRVLRASVKNLQDQNAKLQDENRKLREENAKFTDHLDAELSDAPSEPADKQPAEDTAEAPTKELFKAPLTEEQKAILRSQAKRMREEPDGEWHWHRANNHHETLIRTLAGYGQAEACLAHLQKLKGNLKKRDDEARRGGHRISHPSTIAGPATECANTFLVKWDAPEAALAILRLAGRKQDARLWDKLATRTKSPEHLKFAISLYRAIVAKSATNKAAWERIRALELQLKAAQPTTPKSP